MSKAAPGICLALALALAACGGGGESGDQKLRDGLQAMVIQQTDIPGGLQPLSGDFADNAQAASGVGGPTEEQLNTWGRLLGYKRDFQAAAPSADSAVTALSTSASLYKTDQGASESFKDRVASARRADWKTSHSDLTDFQQQELTKDLGADDLLWLRFTGHKETAPGKTQLISDDQIVFRAGRAWGFHGIVSTGRPGVDDRSLLQPQIETLVRKQIQQMRDALKSGLPG